jgi:hypothetical protein
MRAAESAEGGAVRVSARSKATLLDASRRIGEAVGKAPPLSDLVDELVARYAEALVRHRVGGPALPTSTTADQGRGRE